MGFKPSLDSKALFAAGIWTAQASDHPDFYADDPDALALLEAIGAGSDEIDAAENSEEL
jgi:hypothetical protein